jgi:glutamate racemase
MMANLKDSSITKLGVFDSGVGGLTVLKELLSNRSGHQYVYFGDTAHVPYGSRKADDVISLVTSIARYLVGEGCQGLILACNTSSALAINALRATVNVPLIGVIGTAAKEAAHLSDRRVVVLANPLTAASGVYKDQIQKEAELLDKCAKIQVLEIGCPDLVSIVENEQLHTEESARILRGYAQKVSDFEADTLVLGCTHYPLLLPVLRPMLHPELQVVNPANLIPDYLAPSSGPGVVEYKVSGEPESFERAASGIIGLNVKADQVILREMPAMPSQH